MEYFTNDETKFILTIMGIIELIGLSANGLTMFAILTRQQFLEIPTNIFLLSQAFADLSMLIMGLVIIPHVLYTNNDVSDTTKVSNM